MSHLGSSPSLGANCGVSRDVRARMGGRVDPKDAWWQKDAPPQREGLRLHGRIPRRVAKRG